MSIVPVGKNRHQVNQGGFKHETMLESDVFSSILNKVAFAPGTLTEEDDTPEVADDLRSTMNSGGLNPERGMPEGADMGGTSGTSESNKPRHMQFGQPGSQTSDQNNPEDWKYDPKTGEPLSGMSGEDVYHKAWEMFSPANLDVSVNGNLRESNWKIVISPGRNKAVSKN